MPNSYFPLIQNIITRPQKKFHIFIIFLELFMNLERIIIFSIFWKTLNTGKLFTPSPSQPQSMTSGAGSTAPAHHVDRGCTGLWPVIPRRRRGWSRCVPQRLPHTPLLLVEWKEHSGELDIGQGGPAVLRLVGGGCRRALRPRGGHPRTPHSPVNVLTLLVGRPRARNECGCSHGGLPARCTVARQRACHFGH
jgi:hypothetical protein